VKALGADVKRSVRVMGLQTSENGVQLLLGAKSLVHAESSAAVSHQLSHHLPPLSPPSNSPAAIDVSALVSQVAVTRIYRLG